MSKFKVGDKVKCIQGSLSKHGPKVGQIYEVYAVEDNLVAIDPNFYSPTNDGWYDHRFELVPNEPAVYSVRQVAEAIHEVTGMPKLPDYEERISQINAHLTKVNDPDWKKFKELEVEYNRLKEKFNA